jgi:hypothetical protein
MDSGISDFVLVPFEIFTFLGPDPDVSRLDRYRTNVLLARLTKVRH